MNSEDLAAELTDQDRILLVFAYLWPLGLLTLVATRREFVRWHAKQGLLLSSMLVVLYLGAKAIHLLLRRFGWGLFGELFWITAALVGVGFSLLLLLSIVRALDGERFRIPLLGEWVDRL